VSEPPIRSDAVCRQHTVDVFLVVDVVDIVYGAC